MSSAEAALPSWQEIANKKREEVAAKIPSEWRLSSSYLDKVSLTSRWNVLAVPGECGILSEQEIQITEGHDAVSLVKAIAAKTYSAEQVATAFCKRAAIAQQLTSCLTEIFFKEALSRARELDAYYAETGKVKGPFHGLPISLKECFNIKGQATTMGYVSFVSKPIEAENSPLAQILLDLGAILYVKTNIPQTMMSAESENNVFGRVLNPHNLALGPGGSSGGEGALVALRGSLLGVGTDVAGSIRIPALCCGLFGFKPSTARIPYGDQGTGRRQGNPGLLSAAGPLATSARDLHFFIETVIGAKPWDYDSSAFFLPFRSAASGDRLLETRTAGGNSKALTFGYIAEDPFYPVHPPVRRALEAAVGQLRKAGHSIVPIKLANSDQSPHNGENGQAVHNGGDGQGNDAHESNDDTHQNHQNGGEKKQVQTNDPFSRAALLSSKFFSLDNAGTSFRYIAESGEPMIASLKRSLGGQDTAERKPLTLDDLFAMNVERAEFVAEWQRIWLDNGLDAIILPGHRSTAVGHEKYGFPSYTVIWNLLDYPACSVPYGHAGRSLDGNDPSIPEHDADLVHGAPCSIQVVGRRFQDEELLGVVQIISDTLGSGNAGSLPN